jgi:hypothetical protein
MAAIQQVIDEKIAELQRDLLVLDCIEKKAVA